MTREQALDILRQVCEVIQADYKTHLNIQLALKVLTDATIPPILKEIKEHQEKE